MTFTKILSEKATLRLGNFEKVYQSDPVGREAVTRYGELPDKSVGPGLGGVLVDQEVIPKKGYL